MPGPGWHSILAALEAKASDQQDPDYGSDFSKRVRGYTSNQMEQTAKHIYRLLGPRNQEVARQHVEGAEAVVRVWWNNGFGHLIEHGKKPFDWQANWRNLIREDARKHWCERENASCRFDPIPDDWSAYEAVRDVRDGQVPTDVYSGRLLWLPHGGGKQLTLAGTASYDIAEDRLQFVADPAFPAELQEKCLQEGPFLYIWETGKKGTKEVVKIGMGGNGVHSSVDTTLKAYCAPFPMNCTDPLGPRSGPAKMIAWDLSRHGCEVCCLYICILPEVTPDRDVNLPGNPQIAARPYEDGCVKAHQAHFGKLPKGNVQEAKLRWEDVRKLWGI